MPLTTNGEGYRTFTDVCVFEATTTAQIRQIFQPIDKGHVLMAPDDGSGGLQIFKFDLENTSGASATVLIPNNPFYAVSGRWVLIATATSSGGGGANMQGVIYSAGTPPNPPVLTSPATAYDRNGILPTYYWDTVGLAWV